VPCVSNVASFSGLSILDCPFGSSNVYFTFDSTSGRSLTICSDSPCNQIAKNSDNEPLKNTLSANTFFIRLVMCL
jgi:hypothetical protein